MTGKILFSHEGAVFLPIPFLCQFREPGCQIVFSCKKLSPSAYRAAIARYA